VQQSRGASRVAASPELAVSEPGDAAEREADRVADAVTGPAGVAPPIVESASAVARAALPVSQIDQAINLAKSAVPGPGIVHSIAYSVHSRLPQLIGHQQGEIASAPDYPGGPPPKKQPASPVPKADNPAPIDTTTPVVGHYFPSGRLQSTERALI